MKTIIYAHRWNGQTLTEKEFEEKKTKGIEAVKADRGVFEEWLGNNYYIGRVFRMSEKTKERVLQEFAEYCKEYWDIEEGDDWKRVEKEND